jgi:ATP-dependent protease ClpP protease subunit
MINIFGVIGQDVKASEVMQEIQAYEGDKIEVIINSVGGSVYEGMAIYGALKNDPRPIKTTVLGIGASIASVIFMAGDEREIGEGSQLMIHNSLAPNAGGNKYEMKEAIERLEQIDSDMKKIYSSGTGLQDQILESMLEKETFLNADEALKLGFATGKGDVLELVAIYNENKYKEEAMAELDEKEMGFLQAIFAKLGFSPKAESDEPEAMEEEEEEAQADESAEAPEAMEEPSEEAMEEDEEEAMDDEKEEMKARIAELELALEAKLDKEVEAQKHSLVFEAIKDNKLTLAECPEVMALSLEDVQAKLEEASISPSGYEKSAVPMAEMVDHYAEYKARSGADQSAYFAKHKDIILNEMNKDK